MKMNDLVSSGLSQGQNDSGKSVGDIVRLYHDWRIHLASPDRSVVFAPVGGKIAPCSSNLPDGTDLNFIFFRIADSIRDELKTQKKDIRSFSVNVDGTLCRAERVNADTYHLRVVSDLIEFEKLGLPQNLVSHLMSSDMDRGGLIIVCGSYGCGKTTTVTSVVRERLRRRGGLAVLIGSPVEYWIHGFHGVQSLPGYIEQIDISSGSLKEEIHSVMRSFATGSPGILVFPELRSTECVGEMLRAANRGSLVFLDMHALNIDASILNLVSMAEQDGEQLARALIGNSLRLVLHQSMTYRTGAYKVEYDYTIPTRQALAAIQDVDIPLSRALRGVGEHRYGTAKK